MLSRIAQPSFRVNSRVYKGEGPRRFLVDCSLFPHGPLVLSNFGLHDTGIHIYPPPVFAFEFLSDFFSSPFALSMHVRSVGLS